jgi:phage portal protein BeeE
LQGRKGKENTTTTTTTTATTKQQQQQQQYSAIRKSFNNSCNPSGVSVVHQYTI